jgi:hypothetical protein
MIKPILIYLMKIVLLSLIIYQPIIADSKLPQGQWHYTVTGDTLNGNITVRRMETDGVLTTTSSMNLKSVSTIIISDETIRETMAFNPIQYSSKATLITNNDINRTEISAKIAKEYIIVTENKKDTLLKLKSDLVFGTNKFLDRAIKSGFKRETFSYILYDPSVNSRKILRLSAYVNPSVPVMISETEKLLNHITFFINLKSGEKKIIMEIFCDSKGIVFLFKFNIDNRSVEFVLQ